MAQRRAFASDNPSETVTASPTQRIRNVAIIAHVDHGKTTLVDGLLKQSHTRNMEGERVMDSNAQEKERGITILAKSTAIGWVDKRDGLQYQLNIVDTPGHADFGGEVERSMNMVDGVVLVVDAHDGPMTQTRYVLSKALQKGLKAFVVLNKMDRVQSLSRVDEVENLVFDLFATLGASEEQLDFPFVYAAARSGWASLKKNTTSEERSDFSALYETIITHIPPPSARPDLPFSMLVTNIERNSFFGKMLLGKIHSGSVRPGDTLRALDPESKEIEVVKVTKLLCKRGLDQSSLNEGIAGDIISVAGFSKATVNSTLCDMAVTVPIPSTPIDPPTVSITFAPNSSPLSGTEGSPLTAGALRERLVAECEHNVSLRVVESENRESFEVHGRGELQLGVLIENMRREKLEFSVYPPKVVLKKGEGKQMLEPIEECFIEVPKVDATSIMQALSARGGEMQDFNDHGEEGRVRMTFRVPTRGLLGFRAYFQNETRGSGIFNHAFHSYMEYAGAIDRNGKGALICSESGAATPFALTNLETRGVLFIGPGAKVYPGMVVGENAKDGDMEVNPTKEKAMTNVRAVEKQERWKLTPPRLMSLEEYISYVRDDEVLECTPFNIRLRKQELDANKRSKLQRHAAAARRADKASK